MKNTAIALALSAALSMSACGLSTSGSTEGSPSSGTNRPAETPENESAETVEDDTAESAADTSDLPEVAEEGMPVQDFGQAFTYVDGIQITVDGPTPITSGPYASPENTKGSAFTVTIVNGSDVPFDPSMAYLTVQSGNTEAEEIYDSEAGFGGSPETTLLPGREATFKAAFATSDPSDIVLEMTPSFEHVAALYATNAGS